MAFPGEPDTRLKKTCELYLKNGLARAIILAMGERLRKMAPSPHATFSHDVLIALLARVFWDFRGEMLDRARSTIRGHIAAISYQFSCIVEEGALQPASAALYQEAHRHGLFAGASVKRTSACKRKTFTGNALELILESLKEGLEDFFGSGGMISPPNGWSPALMTWAMFTVLYYSAARPCEVATMRWFRSGNQFWFVIRNAKSTNGRSHGRNRTVVYRDLDEDQIRDIELAMMVIFCARTTCGKPRPWKYLMGVASRGLKAHVQQRFGRSIRKNYTMYTLRHQLFADLKQAKVGIAEISAIAGHSVTQTVFRHYARGRYGKARRSLPSARPEEVARVKQNYKPPSNRKTMTETVTGPREP